MKLYDTGVYLLNGQKIVPENQADFPVSKEEAAKSTIAYSILKAHNTSGNMEKLQIKFDKLTSHDITFVGIIQTARASGLEKFPVPYVLTNCHNSLCVMLIHWPVARKVKGRWRIMEKYVDVGKIRAIGVSNFNPHHVDELLAYARIKPVVNQIKIHPYMEHQEVVGNTFAKGIQVQ